VARQLARPEGTSLVIRKRREELNGNKKYDEAFYAK
jgi:hypothetical protein